MDKNDKTKILNTLDEDKHDNTKNLNALNEDKYEKMYVEEDLTPKQDSLFGYVVKKIKKLISKINPYG